ncbi:hypothetical protein N8H09_10320 [Curtobacterium flaccumfaciens]|nr:hypothetical protein [Curtobacterium flaccumfaciens]MCU0115170.1 hypothetical protein [Curtobacterium flaccumfaciens]
MVPLMGSRGVGVVAGGLEGLPLLEHLAVVALQPLHVVAAVEQTFADLGVHVARAGAAGPLDDGEPAADDVALPVEVLPFAGEPGAPDVGLGTEVVAALAGDDVALHEAGVDEPSGGHRHRPRAGTERCLQVGRRRVRCAGHHQVAEHPGVGEGHARTVVEHQGELLDERLALRSEQPVVVGVGADTVGAVGAPVVGHEASPAATSGRSSGIDHGSWDMPPPPRIARTVPSSSRV